MSESLENSLFPVCSLWKVLKSGIFSSDAVCFTNGFALGLPDFPDPHHSWAAAGKVWTNLGTSECPSGTQGGNPVAHSIPVFPVLVERVPILDSSQLQIEWRQGFSWHVRVHIPSFGFPYSTSSERSSSSCDSLSDSACHVNPENASPIWRNGQYFPIRSYYSPWIVSH